MYYSGDFGIEAPDLTGYDLMNAAEKLAYEVQIGMYGPNTAPGVITAYDSYKKVYDDVQRGWTLTGLVNRYASGSVTSIP